MRNTIYIDTDNQLNCIDKDTWLIKIQDLRLAVKRCTEWVVIYANKYWVINIECKMTKSCNESFNR